MRGDYAANRFYLYPIAVRVVFAPVRNGRRRSRGCHSRVGAESAEGTRLGRGDVGEKIGPFARAGGEIRGRLARRRGAVFGPTTKSEQCGSWDVVVGRDSRRGRW